MKKLIKHEQINLPSGNIAYLLTLQSSFLGLFKNEYQEVVNYSYSGSLIYSDCTPLEDCIIRQLAVSVSNSISVTNSISRG